jgi:D-beta-D-heptose 7-phosphate kinase/D-beta-D-heptose 1-phosphate adenosyltransferase
MTNTQQPNSLNVLLIGDSCVDEYIYGTVDRISPESPVPILRQTRRETKPGMAANVKANLEALGCEVDFITNLEPIIKTRYIDERSGYHLLRVDQEDSVVHWSGHTLFAVEEYDCIVISDYCKGFLSYNHIETLRENFTGPIFLDTKKTDLACFHGIFVKINELEYSRRVSINHSLIVTLGGRGAMWKTGRDPKHETYYPAPKVEVFDVCGAGDTFLAALSFGYCRYLNIETAIDFANKAASIAVTHSGNYAPTIEELL